ncbi:MAG: twin-arginine translocase subunit TatC [Burkholderiales bacterium]|nr:twin-arginine translocase subunit TatC [Burkholderiales bacterium]
MESQQDTFISHLVELRDRLLRSLIAIAVVFFALFAYPGPGAIYDLLAAPMVAQLPEGTKMIATGVVSPFGTPVKVTAMAAFLLVLPYVLYQVWAFVAPGLYRHEKRLALPLVVTSTLLFLAGMAFCYFFVFGQVFKFIAAFAPRSITPAPDIEQYFSFVLTMFLAFGLTFEVPVALIVLVRMGIVQIEKLKEIRPYFIVGAFVVAAIVTPPDVVSQLALAIPMCVLYEVGIVMARILGRPAGESDWKAPSDDEMESELDRAEADAKKPE